jgi:MFS family permease
MIKALTPVAALLLSASILLAGQGLQITLLPVRASLEEFSTLSIGVIGAVYFLGFTLGCMKGGELLQRVGHVRVFLAMTAMASASPLVHGLIVEEWAWAMLRFLSGFCFATLYVVIESWLNEQATAENRGVIFGTYVMITLTLMACGQMMVLLYEPGQLHLFALASVLVSIAAVPIALSTSPAPAQPLLAQPDIRKLFRISPAGTIGCLATGLANSSFWALAPVYTAGLSDDVGLAAWFMTATVVGGSIGQWPFGFLSDRIGRRKVLFIVALLAIIAGIGLVTVAPHLGVVGVSLLGALWGAAAFPMYSIAVAHANDFAEPSDYVMVSGSLLLVYGIGAISGPFLASTMMTWIDARVLYSYTAAVHFLFVLYALRRSFRREEAPEEQHIAFGDALTAASTASQVYEEELEHLPENDVDAAARTDPQPL